MARFDAIGQRDFSATENKRLARKGIAIVGLQALPDMTSAMPYANAQTGYVLNDNGTSKVRSYLAVKALASR